MRKKLLSFIFCFLLLVQLFINSACNLEEEPYIKVEGLKIEYFIGEELEIGSAKIHYYESADSELYDEVDLTASMITGFSSEKAGSFSMTITYKKLTTFVDYVVKEQQSPQIPQNPYIQVVGLGQEYYVGDCLNLIYAKVRYYASENAQTYTETNLTMSMITGFSSEEVGTFSMIISYNNIEISVTYTIKPLNTEDNILSQKEAELLLEQAISNMATFTEIKETTTTSMFGMAEETYVILTQDKKYYYGSDEAQDWCIRNGNKWEYYEIREDIWDEILTYKKYEMVGDFDNIIEFYFSNIYKSSFTDIVYVEGYIEDGKYIIIYNTPDIMDAYNKIIISDNKIDSQISYVIDYGETTVISSSSYNYYDTLTNYIPLLPDVEWEDAGFYLS